MSDDTGNKLKNVLHDSLTGLLSSPVFTRRLQDAVLDARRCYRPLSVMAIEIDEAEKFMRDCSPDVFENILKKVGTLIGESIRETDFAARYRHAHFVIALVDSGSAGAEEVASRLHHSVKVKKFAQDELRAYHKISINISAVPYSGLGQTAEELIDEAEKMLLEARKNRNGTFIAY